MSFRRKLHGDEVAATEIRSTWELGDTEELIGPRLTDRPVGDDAGGSVATQVSPRPVTGSIYRNPAAGRSLCFSGGAISRFDRRRVHLTLPMPSGRARINGQAARGLVDALS